VTVNGGGFNNITESVTIGSANVHHNFVLSSMYQPSRPAAPEPLVATAISSTQVGLSWTDVSGESGYNVYQWSGSSWQRIAGLAANTTSYTVNNLSPATTNYFYVESFNSVGGSPTQYRSATTLAAAPAAPGPLAATAVSGSQVNLSWSNVAGETGYQIQSWNGTAWVNLASVGANVTTYSVTGLNPQTQYYYRVGAVNAVGTTYTAYQGVVTLASAPAAPGSLTATAVSGSQVNLSWSDVAGENGYTIQSWNGSAWVNLGSVGANVTTYSVTNLNPQTQYYFRVGAFNASGVNYSAYRGVTTLASPPAAPTTLNWTSGTQNQINLSWSNVAGETGYRIQSWNGSAWVQFATVGANVTSYAFTVQPGVTYYVRVGAYNSAGTSYTDYVTIRR
jgi:hypothetical protein